MIETVNLSKRYGRTTAVDQLNLRIEPGQVVGFLGPNGAGKSTTMNMMTGYLSASEGEILIDGIKMSEDPSAAKRKIGYLPEQPPLYQDMKTEEYLRFAAELKKIPRSQRAEAVQQVMVMTRLESVQGRLIRNCSKGFRQCIGLAQALLGMPKILILDEPMVGLDPKQMNEMRQLIRSLAQTHTVFLSSHLLAEISAMSDRILILDHGRLVADDTPENLERQINSTAALQMQVKGSRTALESVLKQLGLKREGALREENGVLQFELAISAQQDPRETLFYALAEARLPILRMEKMQRSLEDVFLQLTGAQNEQRLEDEDEGNR